VFQQSGTGFSGKAIITTILTAAVLMLPGILSAASDNDDIIRRIAPAGDVCVIGDACAGSATVASSGSGGGPEDPEQIYNTYCMACHATGANNAPVMGDAEAWKPHIDKGIDTLYQSALNGFNNGAMPPKGLCMDCSEEAIKATVDYIISAVQ